MSKYLGILVSPSGEEFYDAYGPMTKIRDRATRFLEQAVATRAAMHRYGRDGSAFWNSEREHQAQAGKEYRNWTSRVEEVSDDDEKREGDFVYDYPSGERAGDRVYATRDANGNPGWSRNLADCTLWPSRQDALEFVRTLPRHEGRAYAIEMY